MSLQPPSKLADKLRGLAALGQLVIEGQGQVERLVTRSVQLPANSQNRRLPLANKRMKMADSICGKVGNGKRPAQKI